MAVKLETIDPPFVSANPPTTNELAKRIVRKAIRIKASKASSNGAPYFAKVENGLSKLWDHLNGDVQKELNLIKGALNKASARNGDQQAFATAIQSVDQAMMTLSALQNQIGRAQSSVRHIYSSGTRTPIGKPLTVKR